MGTSKFVHQQREALRWQIDQLSKRMEDLKKLCDHEGAENLSGYPKGPKTCSACEATVYVDCDHARFLSEYTWGICVDCGEGIAPKCGESDELVARWLEFRYDFDGRQTKCPFCGIIGYTDAFTATCCKKGRMAISVYTVLKVGGPADLEFFKRYFEDTLMLYEVLAELKARNVIEWNEGQWLVGRNPSISSTTEDTGWLGDLTKINVCPSCKGRGHTGIISGGIRNMGVCGGSPQYQKCPDCKGERVIKSVTEESKL